MKYLLKGDDQGLDFLGINEGGGEVINFEEGHRV